MAKIVLSLSKAPKSKKKKEASPRSKFLSAMMKKFGGELGQAAVDAFDDHDSERLHKAFSDVADALANQWSDNSKEKD